MFHFTGYGSYGPIVFGPLYPDITLDGFSHSDIHGSTRACRFPWLIATYYVLHRLSSPRHPPCALSSLITNYPSGSLLQEFQTEYSQLFVVYPLHCMQLSKNTRRPERRKLKPLHTSKSSKLPTGDLSDLPAVLTILTRLTSSVKAGGRDRIRTYDPALIKRML